MVKLEAKKLFLQGLLHGGFIATYEIISCALIIYLYLQVDSSASSNSLALVLLLLINIAVPFVYIGCRIKRRMMLPILSVLAGEKQYLLFYPFGIAVWLVTWLSFYSDIGVNLTIAVPLGLMFHTIHITIFIWMGSWFCRVK